MAMGMTRPVTRTSRFRKIWISSLRAMVRHGRSPFRVRVVRSGGPVPHVASRARKTSSRRVGPASSFSQLHAVVVCPRKEAVEVLLEIEGLDVERPVERPDGRRLRSAGGQPEGDDRRQGLRELARPCPRGGACPRA